jgi:hypothetical protein
LEYPRRGTYEHKAGVDCVERSKLNQDKAKNWH